MLEDIEQLSNQYYKPELRRFCIKICIDNTDNITYLPIDSPQTAKYELKESTKIVTCTEPKRIQILKTKGINSIKYTIIYADQSSIYLIGLGDKYFRAKLESYTLTLEKFEKIGKIEKKMNIYLKLSSNVIRY